MSLGGKEAGAQPGHPNIEAREPAPSNALRGEEDSVNTALAADKEGEARGNAFAETDKEGEARGKAFADADGAPRGDAFAEADEEGEDSVNADFALYSDAEANASDPLFEHFRVAVDPGQVPLRVDKFLINRMQHTSRTRIQQAAGSGNIRVDGRPVRSSYKVKPGQVITLVLSQPKRDFTIVPENIPLDIAYEDPYLLVVNKPAGLVVHPGNGNFTGTLVHALAYYLRHDPAYDPNAPSVGLVHRIDKDTSGLLLVAKRPQIKTELAKQFFYKTTGRTYQAVVWGRVEPNQGRIEGNITRDPSDRTRMTVVPPSEPIGKSAVTHYSVVEPLGFVSVVECRLETGRTHQIRAHFKSLHHPLFADAKYGGDQVRYGNRTAKYLQFVENCLRVCPRQALHAQTLSFTHPVTGERISLSAPMPQDMQELIARWRRYAWEASAHQGGAL